MDNPMNSFNLDYSVGCDDSQDVGNGLPAYLASSLSAHDATLMGYPNHHVGQYAFSAIVPPDGDLSLQAFERPAGPHEDLEGLLPNAMLTFESGSNPEMSMPMNFDPGNTFAYDVPITYPTTPLGFAPSMGQNQMSLGFSHFPQSFVHSDQYLQQPPTATIPHHRDPYSANPNLTANFDDSDSSRNNERQQVRVQQQLIQERQRQPPYEQPILRRPQRPVAIQPKRPIAVIKFEGHHSPGLSTPGAGQAEHAGIYSSSGFDVLGVLSRVAVRPNPKINIGAVDLSCAFVLCDILMEDHPIVYVSEAFERLTGYTKDEIVGRNCRFLQSPEGQILAGAKRSFVDGQTVYRLRSTINRRSEIQASIINYRKGGQPFMNLVTMIPIQWDSEDYRFYVGFQVDLVEKPDAVKMRNPDGSYNINYRRDQLSQYVVPPPEIYRVRPDLVTHYGHDQVTAILNAASVPGSVVSRHYIDRILVENTDDVIHVLSFDGEFLYLSPSCRRILEYDPAELVGKTLSTVCHPSDIGPVIRDLRASITTAPLSVVYRIRQKYQGYIWFESHGAWHIDPNQGRKYLVMNGRPRPVYALDQIARLGFSAALAENDVWAKVSLSGLVLFVTSKVKIVLGRSPEDLIGKSLHDLMVPEAGPNAISDALEAAVLESGSASDKTTDMPPSFAHQIRHKKGYYLRAHTTLYIGDKQEGSRPSFLVAQIRFARASPPSSAAIAATEDENSAKVPGSTKTTTLTTANSRPPHQSGTLGQRIHNISTVIGLNGLPPGNRSISPSDRPATFFTELNTTRASSWQIELRELEKQNRTLADELQRLLNRRKKRKRKQSAIAVEKSCATCGTKNTPEWRRGPSGNRDLCNSCGLRWAKQVRSQAQAASGATSAPAPVPTTTAGIGK